MKKIGLLYREKNIEQLKSSWLKTEVCIFISFNKVAAFAFNRLRNQLKKEDAPVLVSKNSLIKRTFENLSLSDAENFIDGSMGLVFVVKEKLVDVCKVLVNFSKENQGLILKGAFLKQRILSVKELEEFSKLPSRDLLLATSVMSIASPLTGFLYILNNIILKFLWLAEELKKKKEQQ